MNEEYTAIYDLEFGKRHGLHETVKIRVKEYPKGRDVLTDEDYPAGAYLEPLKKCPSKNHEDVGSKRISLVLPKVKAFRRLQKTGCSLDELYKFFMQALDKRGHFYAVEVFDWFFGNHTCSSCQDYSYESLRDSILDECQERWEEYLEDDIKARLGLKTSERPNRMNTDMRIANLESEVKWLKKCLCAHIDKYR